MGCTNECSFELIYFFIFFVFAVGEEKSGGRFVVILIVACESRHKKE